MSDPVLLQAVAQKAGVSTPTASLVLNGHHAKARIAEATRERVIQAAAALGYQANPFASGLRSKRSHSIGVLWSFSGPHHSSQLLREFSGRALESGYTTLVYDSLNDPSVIARQLNELSKRRVEGVVMNSFHGNEPQLAQLVRGIPHVVYVAKEPIKDHPEWGQVVHTPAVAIRDAVVHLVSRGRKRFGFAGVLQGNEQKLGIIDSTLKAHGIEAGISATANLPTPERLSHEERKQHLKESPLLDMDAVFCATDEVAASLITAFRLNGRTLPDDVAIIGFNNSPIAGLFDLPIASVERFDNLVAAAAIETIIQRIEGTMIPPTTLEMTFIPRASAGL